MYASVFKITLSKFVAYVHSDKFSTLTEILNLYTTDFWLSKVQEKHFLLFSNNKELVVFGFYVIL